MKKYCSNCKIFLDICEFGRHKEQKYGKYMINSLCKVCAAKHHAEWYQKHKDREVQKQLKYRRQEKDRIAKREAARYKSSAKVKTDFTQWLKSDIPCMDCGVQYPYYVMDFDHRPGVIKSAGISELIHSKCHGMVLWEEILKCDIVCANCHRARTYNRM